MQFMLLSLSSVLLEDMNGSQAIEQPETSFEELTKLKLAQRILVSYHTDSLPMAGSKRP